MTTEARTIEFHEAFGHPVRTKPQTLSREEAILALALIEEEYLELVDALFPELLDEMASEYTSLSPVRTLKREQQMRKEFKIMDRDMTNYAPNLIKVADAVADLDVVVNGAGIRHGFDMQALSREVFDSNMSKLGIDGEPILREDGKILKGPGFREPDIAGVLGIGEAA